MSSQLLELEEKETTTPSARPNAAVGTILVVDDEPELKSILVQSILKQGYEVTGCSSGVKALAALREQNFDLLLTDLMMPDMDGIALLKAALEIDPHLVGIMMTGQGTIQTAVDAMKLGAFDYVLKPFRMQSLMPVLTRAMNVRHLRLENVHLRETVAIHGLAQTISFTLDPQTVLSKLADAALEQSDADEVSILLPTNDGKELYVAMVRGEKRERLLGERVPLEKSIASWVARERTPLILNGEVRDERFVALWPRPDIRSAVSVPMQVANKLVGILNLNVINRVRPFTLGQMKALTILAGTAAAALESASLYRQVQRAEEKYRSIFENAIEGIFQATPEGRFITVNPSLARIMGYDSPQEMIATITDAPRQFYVDPDSRAEAARIEKERGVLRGFEFRVYRKDGTKIWLSGNRRSVRNEAGVEIYREGSVENITERKRAEAERLLMFEIVQGVLTTTNLDELLKLIHHSISKFLYAENCFVALHDETTNLIHFELWADQFDPVPLPHPPGKGFSSYVLRTNQPLLLTEELKSRMYSSGEVEQSGRSSASWLGVPLGRSSRAIGVLVVQHYEDKHAYSQRDLEFLSSVGDQIALAIERKQAEKALRESEERYRDLVENANDLIYEHDLKGNFTATNKASERITGYSLEESLKLNLAQTVAPENLEKAQEMLRRKLAGESVTVYDMVVIAKDGRRVPVEVNTRLVFEDGVPVGVQGIARDVTERKRVEELQARRAAHALFRADVSAALAMSNAPLRDTLESCVTAMVQHLGAAFARIWTLNREEEMLELQASAGLYTHLDGPHARVPVGSFKIGKIAQERAPHITNEVQTDPRVGDKEWARREGMVAFAGYPLLLENRILGVMAMFSREELAEDTLDALASVADLISHGIERQRAEEGLRESEARYRLLFESNPQPMWVYDLETLAFLAVNEAAVRHYGYSREDFLAMTIKDIRPAEDISALYDSVSTRSEGVGDAGVWKHLKKDGAIIEVEITSHLLVFDDRRAELILAHDITERNRLEAALLASEEQLRQSQKLEAIGQLAGGVAHDFNNLLTVIGGYSSILLDKLPQESPHRGSVEEIKKAGDRAGALTRQLLAFSRKQILQPKVLDLNVVVTDLEKMVRRLIGEDIDLLTIASPVLGKVKADPGQIEQVLLNLIVNARDAMPKGGKLTIETRNVVLSEDYAQRHAAQAGPYVMLAVSDTGHGMEAVIQPRIFDPFFTTKGSGKGTGLGLATVYGIVKQSGGNIWVYSEIGRGSTFKIYLPRIDEVGEGEEAVGSSSIPQGTELILLVEDEDQVRAILTQILEGQGYQVLAASNGEEALSISQDLKHDIKLMITDVVMPQMSGRELVERVLTLRPDLPVLFMSGYTDDAIVRHGLLDQKFNFLQKPFDSATVARKVRNSLDSHPGVISSEK